MGKFTERLMRRNMKSRAVDSRNSCKPRRDMEHLTACAIIRGGVTHSGCRSHQQLRHQLGDEAAWESMPGDIEGFMSSRGNFLRRHIARDIAARAGQADFSTAPLLSSDVHWWPQ